MRAASVRIYALAICDLTAVFISCPMIEVVIPTDSLVYSGIMGYCQTVIKEKNKIKKLL